MALAAFIAGCSGTGLDDAERRFFRETRPCGLILFERNCETPEQVSRLTSDFRDAAGSHEPLVLVDQEGGRIQRMKPPEWPAYPAQAVFGEIYRDDPDLGIALARRGASLIAADLEPLGINVDCLPLLDVPAPDAHAVIGNRALGSDPETVARLGRAVCEGLMAKGVLPVIKHIPGHGRADADSHESLPVITASRAELEAVDFPPFHALRDMPLAMTAHVLMPEFDPDRPASTSRGIIGEVIRGSIGFDGALMCDDLSMQALEGDMRERTQAIFAAGCDLALHCNGDLAEMELVAASSPRLEGDALRRFDAAVSRLHKPEADDGDTLDDLMSDIGALERIA